MDVYKTECIRNVVLLGHGGAGKTTLSEAMAYLSGMTSRQGRVEDGNTVSDYDKQEIKRHFSISTTLLPIPWKKNKINILDTPGYFDFVGEVEEAAGVADAAVIVISGKAGVQVGTEKAWNLCEKYNLPRIFYITDMDNGEVSFRKIVEELQDKYGKKVVPVRIPVREDGKFLGSVDVVRKAGCTFVGKGECKASDIPGHVEDELEQDHDTLMEDVAETSEEFMDRYFEGDEFTPEEVAGAVAIGVQDCSMIPVSMGSPVDLKGVANLLDDIVDYFPNPSARKCSGTDTKSGKAFEANYDASAAKSAYVWKTIADPFLGKYSFIKVCSGVVKSDDTLLNVGPGEEERLNKLYVLQGSKPIEVPELQAGDIGAIAKLNSVSTGDTLSTKAVPVQFERTQLSVPYTYKRYKAVKKGEEDKIAQALAKLMSEDNTLKTVNDGANRQTLIYGIGDQQLDVVADMLKERYKVEIELCKPKVPFRETIRKKSDVEGKHKKQSGGHGQYGHVKMRFEPSGDMEQPYVFEQEVVGGSVPKNYFPAVEKGIQECVQKGPLAAYPVVGLKAVLYDGSYHPVDSSEMAFKTAASLAFKKGFMDASPVLLEPIVSMKVTVPDKFTGDVMGDLNKRRGRVLGMNPDHHGNTTIEADVPMLEIYGYSTDLRSMTGGSGEFAYEFARYEQAPAEIQQKEIDARAELAEGED